MSKPKKKTKILIFFSIFLTLVLFSAGIFLYLYYSEAGFDFLKKTKGGITIEAQLYDTNGNPVEQSLLQSTITSGTRSQAGVFYMSLKIKASNTGNVLLSNLRLSGVYGGQPNSVFSNALQGVSALQPNLAVGQNNILEWDTANLCPNGQSDCGNEENCISGKCLIPIGEYSGDVAWGFTLNADYIDAIGSSKTASSNINLQFNFQPESVVFRTNAKQDTGTRYKNAQTTDATDGNLVWIAFDLNGDGNLEKYGKGTSTTGTNRNCDESSYPVLLYLPYGSRTTDVYLVRGTSTYDGQIGVCINGALAGNSNTCWYTTTTGGYINAVTYQMPIEPYRSQNCNGAIPCQERYMIRVTPPTATCEDNYKNQDETDIDCGGSLCSKCNVGKGCIQNSDCFSNLCSTRTCQVSQHVNFRTTDLTYGSNSQIAFSTTCGSLLARAREYSYIHTTAPSCEADSNWNGGGTICNNYASCKIMENLPYQIIGSGASLSSSNFVLIKDESDVGYVFICVNDADANGYYRIKYKLDETITISNSPDKTSYVEPQMDKTCD